MGLEIKPVQHLRHHGMLRLALGAEAAEAFSAASDNLQSGVLPSAIAGVGLTAVGVHHLREAMQNRCIEEALEGSSSVVLGLHSCTHAMVEAGTLLQHHGLISAAHATHPTLTALGLINGSLDFALGTWQVAHRLKHGKLHAGGLLTIGLGGATVAAALGGGLPATIAATLFLAGRLALEESSMRPPTPPVGPGAWHVLSHTP
ncbi:MAG: hypothetical protein ACYCW6_09110 [Candidatus Xenobia bacterium]